MKSFFATLALLFFAVTAHAQVIPQNLSDGFNSTIALPQVAAGLVGNGQWGIEVDVTSLVSTPQNFNIDLVGSDGKSLDLDGWENAVFLGHNSSYQSRNFPGLGSVQVAFTSGTEVRTGTALLRFNALSDGSSPLAVQMKFRFIGAAGNVLGESSVLPGVYGVSFSLPVLQDSTMGSATGIAVSNPSDSPITVIFTLHGQNGLPITNNSNDPIIVKAWGEFGKFLREIFPTLPPTFKGSVDIEIKGGNASAVGLQLTGDLVSTIGMGPGRPQ